MIENNQFILNNQKIKKFHPYDSPEYFKKIISGYYPYTFIRDKIITNYLKKLIPKKGKLLEIGCGTGMLLSHLESYFETYGLDISKYALEIARQKLKSPRLHLLNVEEEFLTYPFYFDSVISMNTIEHLNNPIELFIKIRTVLKEKGFLFIFLPTASNSIGRFLNSLFYRDETHIFNPSVGNIKSLLSKAGFQLLYERPYGIFLFLPFSLRILLESIPPYFAIFRKS